jgi:DNA processing protein
MAQDVRTLQPITAGKSCSSIKDDKESRLLTYLVLDQIPRFGHGKLTRLIEVTKYSPEALLCCKPDRLKQLGFDQQQAEVIRQPDMRLIESQMQWLCSQEAHFIIFPEDVGYPPLLMHIASPPLVIFGKGNQQLLAQPQIAIVGSRNPTHYGKLQAFEFAQQLASHDVCITSGLALGIDACAHRGALAADGATIAVLGSGLANVYPKRNNALADQILAANGLLISEFTPIEPPKAHNFPRRNRIVSGLSLGVLVVEAALRSGSLITCRFALEQNRDVMAIPGNIQNPLSAGCHQLIKQGAKLVENITDILEEVQNINSCKIISTQKKLQKSQIESLASGRLLDSVGYDVSALDVIIQRSKLPIEEVLAQLLEYELRGLVASVSGGYIKLRGK